MVKRKHLKLGGYIPFFIFTFLFLIKKKRFAPADNTLLDATQGRTKKRELSFTEYLFWCKSRKKCETCKHYCWERLLLKSNFVTTSVCVCVCVNVLTCWRTSCPLAKFRVPFYLSLFAFDSKMYLFSSWSSLFIYSNVGRCHNRQVDENIESCSILSESFRLWLLYIVSFPFQRERGSKKSEFRRLNIYEKIIIRIREISPIDNKKKNAWKGVARALIRRAQHIGAHNCVLGVKKEASFLA